VKQRLTAAVLMAAGLSIGVAACTSTTSTTGAGSTTAAPTTAGGGSSTTAKTTASTPGTTPGTTMGTTSGTAMATKAAAPKTAAELRTALTLLLNEHVILASQATGAALGGRTDEFNAAAAQLNTNSEAISGAIGLVYGDEAGKAFDGLWKKHIGFFVDYTTALGKGDKAAAQKSADDLTRYATDFAAFLSSANPNLPKDAVAELVKTHILTLKTVVDDQAAKDYAKAYTDLGAAVAHMHMIADPLSAAIAKQFPDKFPGSASSKASDLNVALNSLLAQHVAYAALATDNALGGRTAEFDAAVALLGKNTTDLSDAVGSVFGKDAGTAFKGSWEKHIGFFVDYTKGVAGDPAKKAEAAANLEKYAGDLAAFFNSALPDLPKAAVQELVKGHIVGLEGVIDAQGAKDWKKAYAEQSMGMAHMSEIANPLSAAIVKQMPDKFPTS
jgi:hypothetical protein